MNRRLNRNGYSLIELLVVIGLIAALSVMVVIGIAKLRTNAKRQQTALILENLRAMYADYDTVNRLHFPASPMPCPQNVTVDANPFVDKQPPPAQANDTASANRYGAAVWTTRDMMALLRQVPSNATALGKLPAGSIMRMPAEYSVNYPLPYMTPIAVWNNMTNYVSLTFANSPNASTAASVCSVPYNDPVTGMASYSYYRCLQGNVNVSPPNTLFWMPVTFDDTVPILLDAWGNPIIFVPGATLASPYDPVNDPALVPGSGLMTAGGRLFQMASPDGRPFFASAGPDGDFSKGDDNMYSFEK